MAKTNAVAMESPKRFKQKDEKKKRVSNKPKKQIAAATDIRYYYPQTFEEMWPHRGFIEYKMPPEMIADLLSDRGKNDRTDPQKFLCNYINEEYNLIGYCVRVIAG